MPLIPGVHRYTLNFWCVSPHTLLCLPLLNLHFPHYPKKTLQQTANSITDLLLPRVIDCLSKALCNVFPRAKSLIAVQKVIKKHLGGYRQGLHVPECWLFSCQKYSAEHQMCIKTTNWYKIVWEMCVESGVQLFRS